jgi:hypothetical protein
MAGRTTIDPGRMLAPTNAILVAFLTGTEMDTVLAAAEITVCPAG